MNNNNKTSSGDGRSLEVSLDDIKAARQLLKGQIQRTPLKELSFLARTGSQVFAKFENEQLTGSFKIRGALNTMLSLSKSELARGVVASSAGNHAQGVAFGARVVGAQAHIVMPTTAPIVKINATRAHGAEVILHGEVFDDAYAKALELERERSWVFVHPYLDARVIAGQGTIGLEILDDLPDVDNIVVPIGGGGLISGIARAVKALRPSVKIYGVVSSQAPMMRRLFLGEDFDHVLSEIRARKKSVTTIADGIAIKKAQPEMFESHIRQVVDEIVEVDDNEIAVALVSLLEKGKTVTEGAGATGLAAILAGKIQPQGKTVVVLSGGNIDLNVMSRVIESGLRHEHRLARIAVVVDDLPGNLYKITEVMASERANVLEVYHDRVSADLGLRETRIDLLVESSNYDQIQILADKLKAHGFRIVY